MSNSSTSNNTKDALLASLMSDSTSATGDGVVSSSGVVAAAAANGSDHGVGSSGTPPAATATTNDAISSSNAPNLNPTGPSPGMSVQQLLTSENGGGGLFSDLPIDEDDNVSGVSSAFPFAVPEPPPPPPKVPLTTSSPDPGTVQTSSGSTGTVPGISTAPPVGAPSPPTATAPKSSSSLLEQSGLLSGVASSLLGATTADTATGAAADAAGSTTSGGGGGLFDDIDEEERQRELEQAKAAAEEEQRRRQQEYEQQQRLEEEYRQRQLLQEQQAAQQQQQEEERKRQEFLAMQQQQQQAQQQQQQLQQQQLQYNMQNVHLTNTTTTSGVHPSTNNAYAAPVYGNVVASQPQQQHSVYGQPTQQPPFQSYPPQPQPPPFTSAAPQQQLQQGPNPVLYANDSQPLAGFYRDTAAPYHSTPHEPTPSNVYGGGTQQYRGHTPVSSSSLSSPARTAPLANMGGSPHAGMYNINPNLGRVPQQVSSPSHPFPSAAATTPPPSPALPFGKILVSEPLLISASGSSLFGIRQPPHWSYQIQTQFEAGSNWLVRRRFRHVVALEERLRQECPGAILPPRPDKHATRALEEATAHQSADFALQRALELQCYLNSLMVHPYASKSHAFRLFLSLQDDLGTAWAEVSSNALTRLANVGVGAAMSLSETTARGMGVFQQDEFLPEDSAELLALQSSEATRMGAVLQAVPKLEGCVTLLKEHAEQMGVVGMELQKAKSTEDLQPFEVLANGMLRSSRRTKREVSDMTATLHTFSHHYKLVRYEKLAFADRKHALIQRAKERGKADQRAAQLIMQQRQYGNYNSYSYGAGPNTLDRLEREAAVSDEIATDTVQECEEIGRRIKLEVARITYDRRTEWKAAVSLVANAMKEATSERKAIWTSVREQFLNAYPELR